MNWYIPSLKVRKEQSGHPCPGCSLIMHWKDMIAWAGSTGSVYLHQACAEILFDNPDPDVIHYVESAGDGESPGEEEAPGDSSHPDLTTEH